MSKVTPLGPDGLGERIGFTQLAAGEWDNLSVERRVKLGYVRCLTRWGRSKTTMADVAREAGCSRATVYRLVPGGIDALFDSVKVDQTAELIEHLWTSVDLTAPLDDLLVDICHAAACAMANNEMLRYLLRYEPAVIEPHVTLRTIEGVLEVCGREFVPFMSNHIGAERADRLVEHLVRVVMSYVHSPSSHIDLTLRSDAERLVVGFVIPAHFDSAELTQQHQPPARTQEHDEHHRRTSSQEPV